MSRLCRDCAHDGQCDGLPYCGGKYFSPAYVTCAVCGELMDPDDDDCIQSPDGRFYCLAHAPSEPDAEEDAQ